MARAQAWFPTYIHQAPLVPSGRALNRELAKECQQLREFDEAGRRWSAKNYPGGYTSYGSLDKLHRFSSTFSELERQLLRHARAFARQLDWDLGGRAIALSDCWVNIMPHRVTHSLHLHPNSVISGTYYVATPRGCAGLKFEDPRLSRFMAAPPRLAAARRENRTHVTLPARAGEVILFESWLRHEVPANPLKSERVSISFNFHWA
jgi:uncharacterized protein (TIGR02466 family)